MARKVKAVETDKPTLLAQGATTTCQICGRAIKSSTGVIAHHGYQRPGNGWQTASCMGARGLPYEESCDLIPGAIESVKQFITNMTERLADMLVNPPAELPYTRGSWHKETTMIPRPADFKHDASQSRRFGSYDTLFHGMYYDIEVQIRYANVDLDYMTKRLANWKPPVVEGQVDMFTVLTLNQTIFIRALLLPFNTDRLDEIAITSNEVDDLRQSRIVESGVNGFTLTPYGLWWATR